MATAKLVGRLVETTRGNEPCCCLLVCVCVSVRVCYTMSLHTVLLFSLLVTPLYPSSLPGALKEVPGPGNPNKRDDSLLSCFLLSPVSDFTHFLWGLLSVTLSLYVSIFFSLSLSLCLFHSFCLSHLLSLFFTILPFLSLIGERRKR